MTEPGKLNEHETQALDLTRDLANAIGRMVEDGPTRGADLAEVLGHVHVIQAYILSQPTARANPDRVRRLGGSIR